MERTTSRASGGNGWIGDAAERAALQMRWMSSVLGVGGQARPVEALMMVASRLKLPVLGKRLICWSFIALTG
jgi:hypothetical protein